MAFADGLSTFYIPEGVGHSGLWGTVVGVLQDVADVAETGHSLIHTGTSTTERAWGPQSTNNSSGNSADIGYGVDPTDMNSVVGALRYIPAGTWTLTTGGNRGSGDANGNRTLELLVYKVDSGGSRTLIGSDTNVESWTDAVANKTVSVALPQIDFAAGESLHIGIRTIAAGVFLNDLTLAVRAGHYSLSAGGTDDARIDFPGLFTEANEARFDASITGSSAVSGEVAVGKGFAASLSGSAAVNASMDVGQAFQAALTGDSALNGDMAIGRTLQGLLTGDSQVDALMAAGKAMHAPLTGDSELHAAVAAAKGMQVSMLGQSQLNAQMGVGLTLSADILGQAVVTGPMISGSGFASALSAGAHVQADLAIAKTLFSQLTGNALLQAFIDIEYPDLAPTDIVVTSITVEQMIVQSMPVDNLAITASYEAGKALAVTSLPSLFSPTSIG